MQPLSCGCVSAAGTEAPGRMGAGRLEPSTPGDERQAALGCASMLPRGSLFGIWQSLMVSMRLSDCTLGSPLLCHNPASVICESDFLFFSLFCQLISEEDDD